MNFRRRIIAFLIDMFIFMIIFVIINIIPYYDDYVIRTYDYKRSHYIVYAISLVILFTMFIAKDVVGGQSIGKRIAKIKVVITDKKRSAVWWLIIRNITFIIWPIDAFLLLINKNKLGDRIAGTEVIKLD